MNSRFFWLCREVLKCTETRAFLDENLDKLNSLTL